MNINLTLIASAAVSILFAYIPGFKDFYEPLDPTKKRLIMAGILLLVTIGTFAYGCLGQIDGFVCDRNSAVEFVKLYVLAIMANQTTHDLLGKFKSNAT